LQQTVMAYKNFMWIHGVRSIIKLYVTSNCVLNRLKNAMMFKHDSCVYVPRHWKNVLLIKEINYDGVHILNFELNPTVIVSQPVFINSLALKRMQVRFFLGLN